MRGLHFALVDEADSVLIDEAQNAADHFRPRPNPKSTPTRLRARSSLPQRWKTAWIISWRSEERRVFLTVHGQERVAAFAEGRGPPWRSVITREELARQALAAHSSVPARRAIRRRRRQGADRRRIYRARHAGSLLERRPASDDRTQGRLRAVATANHHRPHYLSAFFSPLSAACRHERHAATGGARIMAGLSAAGGDAFRPQSRFAASTIRTSCANDGCGKMEADRRSRRRTCTSAACRS